MKGSMPTNATLEDVRTACPNVDASLLHIECDRLKSINADLLAALEAILPMTGAPHDYTIGDVWKAQEQARAAIAKARTKED